jgi:type IV pilus assembly protein PilY1
MKIRNIEQLIAHPLKKALAMSLSALMTGFVFSATASYASDIEIYQEARSGNISLMFVLDISGSMDYYDANNIQYTSVVAVTVEPKALVKMGYRIQK